MTVRKLPGDFNGSRLVEHGLNGFTIRAVTVVDEGQEVGQHTHEHAHLMLVLKGHYLRRNRGAAEAVRPPFLLFDPPATTHDDCFARSEGSFVSLSVTSSVGMPLPNAPRSLGPRSIKTALRLAKQVRSTIAEEADLEGAAWELLAELDEVRQRTPPPPWAFDAYDLIMDEAADPDLTIRKIAATTNVHPVHLARVFRHVWGCAPADLLRWRRVERAAQLLAKGLIPPAEIALSVGFYDQSHLNRAFKSYFGEPPSRWQRLAMFRKSKTISLSAN